MTAMEQTTQPLPIVGFLRGIREGNTWLWWATLANALGLIICLCLMQADHRMFNGVNVWDKPAKFFLSFAVQFTTLSWALSLQPVTKRSTSGIRWAVYAMMAANLFEMTYMVFRAARAEASHFNHASTVAQVMYGLMGLGAVTLTATAFYIGLCVWRDRSSDLMKAATGAGLMMGMVLATIAGGYMSANQGHWVGGELSDAHGLGLFSWSTTGGDLRVAHFVGMHTAQAIPFAALSGNKGIVFSVAILCVTFTLVTFAMAVLGMPLLRG